MDRFKKVFNGDERLVITFWVWGFIGGIVYSILIGIILFVLGFFGPLAFTIIQLPWYIFIWVSIWRSAGNYQGPGFWAIIAKVLVVLGILGSIYNFMNPTPMPYFG